MQIVLLSGGSGTRLWPLSNDMRSKQFLRLFERDGVSERESMIQRVFRQFRESDIDAPITIATSASQKESVIAQIGSEASIVTEPSRRDTFPAICLACEYLSKVKGCPEDEVVIVMPCDPYTEKGYFQSLIRMSEGIQDGYADLMVMGIKPTYPSAKFGYIVPDNDTTDIHSQFRHVLRFTEKPSVKKAVDLIEQGALWNGGVFVFKLGFMLNISLKYNSHLSFEEIVENYSNYPKISFDYEVAENAKNIGVLEFEGEWKDLGTWDTLTDELRNHYYGNVMTDSTDENTHILNELNIPLLCLGTKDLIIAASPDGIIVSEKKKSENVKKYANELKKQPMYTERRWGTSSIFYHNETSDGIKSIIKELVLKPNTELSYQRHSYRDEVWTIINGKGVVILDGEQISISRGETVIVPRNTRHSIRAITDLVIIETQTGTSINESDVKYFPTPW